MQVASQLSPVTLWPAFTSGPRDLSRAPVARPARSLATLKNGFTRDDATEIKRWQIGLIHYIQASLFSFHQKPCQLLQRFCSFSEAVEFSKGLIDQGVSLLNGCFNAKQ